jgi:RNAse (barnase) inhibitor barstar
MITMTFTIDLTTVHSYYGLHEHLKEVFSLPDGYGRNMDALWDMLHCGFEEPPTIEVKGVNEVPKDLRDVVQRLQLVLSYLKEEDEATIIYL